MEIVVRRFTVDDVDATIEIFLRAIREVSSRDYTPAQVDAWAKVEDRAAWAERRASRPTWIAQSGVQLVGFADLTSDGLLDMMFVHPDFQGRGIASRLLANVENEAQRQGLDWIHTEASKTARPFFERRGFRVLKAQSVEKRGQRLENFLMEKALPHRTRVVRA